LAESDSDISILCGGGADVEDTVLIRSGKNETVHLCTRPCSASCSIATGNHSPLALAVLLVYFTWTLSTFLTLLTDCKMRSVIRENVSRFSWLDVIRNERMTKQLLT